MSRMEANKSRSQLSEQAYLTNRSINQGAQARGLGNSGLKDLSLVQSQIAQGRTLSDLQGSLNNVQNAAMSTRLGLAEQLASSKAGAETQYTQNMVDADKYGVGLEQEKTNQLLQLYQMALESGGTADINSLASIMGINLENMPENIKDAFESTTPVPRPEDKIAFGKNMGNFLIGQSLTQDVLNKINGGNWKQNYFYNFGNGDEKMSSDDALKRVNTLYEGKQYIGDKIKIEQMKNAEWRIGFNYAGKWYPTYNQAKAALEKDLD